MMARYFRYIWFVCLFPLFAYADMASIAEVPKDPAVALKLPIGFKAQVFAKITNMGGSTARGYFRGARMMAFDAEGNLYLSLGLDNKVVMLPDRNHDGYADEVVTVVENLNAPNGLTFADGKLLVANQDGVVRLERKDGKWPASSVTPIISGLATGGHTLKTIKLGPDGYLYINVGSSCNVCVESDPLRATILRYTVEGKPAGAVETVGWHKPNPVWATGLRNSQGFAWHPQTGAMFATNNGADLRSDTKGGKGNDDLPPEHLNRIQPGKNYGWPHCWGNRFADPNFAGPPEFCANMEVPEITFTAHSTPIGITFLDKANFPAEYKTDAIVALHGSWNRGELSGYKLVRVKFNQDKPVLVEDFVTGWLDQHSAWGRPVDVLVGPDGALYVSDDRAGMVYRITYGKK
ncbi:MAG: sorbosone dehydrogenase family protein [Methylophilaceae bacterium]